MKIICIKKKENEGGGRRWNSLPIFLIDKELEYARVGMQSRVGTGRQVLRVLDAPAIVYGRMDIRMKIVI